MTDRDPADDLLERLELLHDRVAELVRQRAVHDPTAADPLRGLFLSPETVTHLLHRSPLSLPAPDGYTAALRSYGPEGSRLRTLAERFALSPLDLHILVSAAAPDVSRRFEPLYGYLNDDVSRRHATVSLALELAGLLPYQAVARARFYPGSALRAGGLLMVDEDPQMPLPARSLRVPERVTGYLLGDDTLDGSLLEAVQLASAEQAPDPPEDGFAARIAGLLADGTEPVVIHLHEPRPGSGTASAVAALRATGRAVLRFDPVSEHLAPALIREARLRRAAIVAGPLPADPQRSAALVRCLEGCGVPVVLAGAERYDPTWSLTGVPLALDVPDSRRASVQRWADELGPSAAGLDLAAAIAPYRLGPEQVHQAARTARTLAALDATALSGEHVQRAARQQSAPMLERHARRVPPGVTWDGLVLPAEPLGALRELVDRARHRERVLGEWGMRSGGGRGRGVVALFAGESGTGKTMSAEVVAGELGLDLYVVDLSTVVDKYIGETEKNLERIFAEADRSHAVLLFDEADAVFGKRSEVKDSHDKHANLQSAYLLQRLEAFDGIALLTTNLRANIDDAFTRRLDLIIDFPFPDAGQRARIWRHCLAGAPCAADLDLDLLARKFELSGGAIHSAAVTAGYLAAGRVSTVTTEDAVRAAEREYRKMGRLLIAAE